MKFKESFTTPIFALIIYLMVFASRYIKEPLIKSGENGYLLVIILQLLIFFVPAVFFCRLKGVGYSSKLNIRLFSPTKAGAVITAALMLIFGSIIIRFTQIYLLDMTSFSYSPFESFVASESTDNFLFTATAFAIMPALSEELIFRAIMLTEYNEGGYGAVNATLITSFLSAFLFFSPEAFWVRFLCGLIFCMVTYATGSSISALISHLIFNIYVVFGEKYIVRAMIDPSNKIIGVFTFTTLFLILTVITLGEIEHCFRKNGQSGMPSPSYLLKKADDGSTPDISATEAEENKTSKKALSDRSKATIEVFFSPTFLICLMIYLIAMFGFI